jgi:hypothetical protein
MICFRSLLDVSYNRPKFAACATWNPNAITFADNSTMIKDASEVFLTANNTVYATSFALDSVLVWTEGSPNVTRRIFGDLSSSHRIFVTTDSDVFADDGHVHSRVQKWTMNATNSNTIMNVSGVCGGLFIDIYNSFYCSHTLSHQIWKKHVEGSSNSSVIIAGTGTLGSAANMLNGPFGIVVDIDLSLYVADFHNNRVQLFSAGQQNGTTVAGNGASGTIVLSNPITVILDGDGYLFIVEYGNHRIVGSGPNGFRCIVACTGMSGSAGNQLNQPRALSFDSYGNLYVADASNHRIQKFLIARNTCGESIERQSLFRNRNILTGVCAIVHCEEYVISFWSAVSMRTVCARY